MEKLYKIYFDNFTTQKNHQEEIQSIILQKKIFLASVFWERTIQEFVDKIMSDFIWYQCRFKLIDVSVV